MQKEGLEQVGDWFEDPYPIMNYDNTVEESINLGTNRKGKHTSVQHMHVATKSEG